MLFANDVVFWKTPNVYDVIGVVGFAIGLASIWLSWWLAKRDIQTKIDEAKRTALGLVDRVTTVLVQTELSESLRCLRETREAIRRKDWVRAGIRIDDVEHHLTRVQGSDRFSPDEAELVRRATDDLTVLGRRVSKLMRSATQKDLSQGTKNTLESLIAMVGQIDTRLRGRLLEGDNA